MARWTRREGVVFRVLDVRSFCLVVVCFSTKGSSRFGGYENVSHTFARSEIRVFFRICRCVVVVVVINQNPLAEAEATLFSLILVDYSILPRELSLLPCAHNNLVYSF
jgi:hypothetical protein